MLALNFWYVISHSICRNLNVFDSFSSLLIHNTLCSLSLVANLAKNYAFSTSDSISMMWTAFNHFECKRQHALLPQCLESLQPQHLFCCDNMTWSSFCSFCSYGLELNHSLIHPCGFILIGINCLFALVPCVVIDCCSLFFLADAAKLFPADAVPVLSAPVELFTA